MFSTAFSTDNALLSKAKMGRLLPSFRAAMARTPVPVPISMVFIFVAVLAPLVEELYFRGYLLPRMKGQLAPLLHSLLFATIHVFTPWMIITRTLGLLPLIFGVKKKNIYIGMIVHILSNSVGFITGVIFITKMS